METRIKLLYEAPLMETVELQPQEMICQSPAQTEGSPTYNGFNTEKEW
ncbi:MAG: hypothetical protein IJU08_09595 [Bacteroidales bacterium]|nr:hypothetical protein [Bacteroidales bacterium]